MKRPKLIICDRDGLINLGSKDETSPYYYILRAEDLILLPGVKEAFALLKESGIPVILCTKQRCLSSGLLTWERLEKIHFRLEQLLDFSFSEIYVEPTEELKFYLFKVIPDMEGVSKDDCLVIDDSIEQCRAALDVGINYIHTRNLLAAVKEILTWRAE
jgi:histidinol phosphatase-like enzyme